MTQGGDCLRFHVLGPIVVSTPEARLRLPGNVARRVLTTLMLSPRMTLSTIRIAEAVWGTAAPATAPHQVRKAVAQLRRTIPGASDLLLTDGPGYRLQVTAAESDLMEFNELRFQAKRQSEAGVDDLEVIATLQAAVELFRGPVAAGIIEAEDTDSGLIRSAAQVVEERKLAMQKQLIQLRMRVGPPNLVIGDLRDLVAQNPLEEDLRGQLMLALSRSGRQADALAEYAEVRTMLVDELGIDPNRQLVELHGAILRGDVEAAASSERAPPRVPAGSDTGTPPEASAPTEQRPAPSTLPHELSDFAGRREEVELLSEMALASPDRPAPLIIAIDGMGGSGKTAIALRAAHQLAEHYPDGQFYVDLRGFSHGNRPSHPSDVLHVLLQSVGVDTARMPVDLDGRVAMWRALLAGSQVLLLLDNAATEAQIVPLLPPGAGSLVLVTSRRRMSELDGCKICTVAPMSDEDGRELLSRVLGPDRIEREPEAVTELIAHCGGLPLALRLAAAKLRSRPSWTMVHLVERMSRQEHRLTELRSGDRSVQSMLQVSYDALTDAERNALRMLGLLPTGDIDIHVAAALLDTTPEDAERLMEGLLDANLLEQRDIGRYCLHDLVADFAATLCAKGVNIPWQAERRAALERMLGYYVAISDRACDLVFPGRADLGTAQPPPCGIPEIVSRDDALAVFERELTTLLAALELAEREGFLYQTTQLARNLMFVLLPRNNLTAYHRAAVAAANAARRLGDPNLLLVALINVAAACWRLGRLDDSLALANEALALAHSQHNRNREAICRSMLGLLLTCMGDLAAAEEHLEHANEHPSDDVDHHVYALCNLSALRRAQGRLPEAERLAAHAVELTRQDPDSSQGAMAMVDLAAAVLAAGDAEHARMLLQSVVAHSAPTTMPETLAQAQAVMAAASLELDDREDASWYAAQAMSVVQQLPVAPARVTVQNLIGEVYLALDRYAEALQIFRRVLQEARSVGCVADELRAMDGVDAVLDSLGRPSETQLLTARRALLRERLAGQLSPAR